MTRDDPRLCDHQVTCERCGHAYAALAQHVSKLPRLLPLHLMRFDYSRER